MNHQNSNDRLYSLLFKENKSGYIVLWAIVANHSFDLSELELCEQLMSKYKINSLDELMHVALEFAAECYLND